MKKIFSLLLTIISLTAIGQAPSKIPLRADSIIMEKIGGNAEFVLRNGTRNLTYGYLQNIGVGKTKFRYVLDSVWIDGDSLRFRYGPGTLAVYNLSGGGGPTYAAGYGLSLSGTTFKVDTSLISTKLWRQKGIDSIIAVLSANYYTRTQINAFFGGTAIIGGYNKVQWDEAYGWGNHAGLYPTISRFNDSLDAHWDAIQAIIAGTPGVGDMLKSVYDTDNDGIPDNSENLGGQLPAYYTTLYKGNGTLTGNRLITGGGNYLALSGSRFQKAMGANIASANNLTLGNDGNTFRVTGTTQINAITNTNWQAGSEVSIIFSGATTVKHNTTGGAGTSKILLSGAADYSTSAEDVLELVYDGTSWHETTRKLATTNGGGRMVYPGAGIPVSTGSAWGTSLSSSTAGEMIRRNLANTGYEFFTPSFSPSGNYGNLQINRNSAFATPASDSLTYTTVGGLVVKNIITTGSHTWTNLSGNNMGVLSYSGTKGTIQMYNTSNGNSGTFAQADLTGSRAWTFPDASGTVALTSDITTAIAANTLDNVMAASGTLTANRSVNHSTFSYNLGGTTGAHSASYTSGGLHGDFAIDRQTWQTNISNSTKGNYTYAIADSFVIASYNIPTTLRSSIKSTPDSLTLFQTNGFIKIPVLTAGASTDSALVYNTTTKKIGYKAFPTGGGSSYTDADAITAPLTGFTLPAPSTVLATDDIISAIEKLQAQLDDPYYVDEDFFSGDGTSGDPLTFIGTSAGTETVQEYTSSTSSVKTLSNTPISGSVQADVNGIIYRSSNVSVVGTTVTLSGITLETSDIVTIRYRH